MTDLIALTLELAMKATTLLGVATACFILTMRHDSGRLFALHLAMGAAGVALVVGNARLQATPLGLAVDVAYSSLCLGALGHFLRDRGRRQRPHEGSQETRT